MNITIISIIIIIILILYYLYKKYKKILKEKKNNPVFIPKAKNAKKFDIISSSEIPELSKEGYSISVWIWINDLDWKKKELKHIFYRGVYNAKKEECQPSMILDKENDLSVYFHLENNKAHRSTIKNIPIGRWFNIIITAYKRTLNIFIDGVLKNTDVSEDTIRLNNRNIYVNSYGGFSGLIAQLRYFPYPITTHKANFIYSLGPKPTLFNKFTKIHEYFIKLMDKITFFDKKNKDKDEDTTELDSFDSSLSKEELVVLISGKINPDTTSDYTASVLPSAQQSSLPNIEHELITLSKEKLQIIWKDISAREPEKPKPLDNSSATNSCAPGVGVAQHGSAVAGAGGGARTITAGGAASGGGAPANGGGAAASGGANGGGGDGGGAPANGGGGAASGGGAPANGGGAAASGGANGGGGDGGGAPANGGANGGGGGRSGSLSGSTPSIGHVPAPPFDDSGASKCWEWSISQNEWVILQPPIEQASCRNIGVRGSQKFRRWSVTKPNIALFAQAIVPPGLGKAPGDSTHGSGEGQSPADASRDSNSSKCWEWDPMRRIWIDQPTLQQEICKDTDVGRSGVYYRKWSPTIPNSPGGANDGGGSANDGGRTAPSDSSIYKCWTSSRIHGYPWSEASLSKRFDKTQEWKENECKRLDNQKESGFSFIWSVNEPDTNPGSATAGSSGTSEPKCWQYSKTEGWTEAQYTAENCTLINNRGIYTHRQWSPEKPKEPPVDPLPIPNSPGSA